MEVNDDLLHVIFQEVVGRSLRRLEEKEEEPAKLYIYIFL